MLDEPKFYSQTAKVSDPVLGHVNSLGMFGRPIFPCGAYLSGRFDDFRDPGHFFGKGWVKLECYWRGFGSEGFEQPLQTQGEGLV